MSKHFNHDCLGAASRRLKEAGPGIKDELLVYCALCLEYFGDCEMSEKMTSLWDGIADLFHGDIRRVPSLQEFLTGRAENHWI